MDAFNYTTGRRLTGILGAQCQLRQLDRAIAFATRSPGQFTGPSNEGILERMVSMRDEALAEIDDYRAGGWRPECW